MIIGELIFIKTWKKEGFETPSICRKFDLGFVFSIPQLVPHFTMKNWKNIYRLSILTASCVSL